MPDQAARRDGLKDDPPKRDRPKADRRKDARKSPAIRLTPQSPTATGILLEARALSLDCARPHPLVDLPREPGAWQRPRWPVATSPVVWDTAAATAAMVGAVAGVAGDAAVGASVSAGDGVGAGDSVGVRSGPGRLIGTTRGSTALTTTRTPTAIDSVWNSDKVSRHPRWRGFQ